MRARPLAGRSSSYDPPGSPSMLGPPRGQAVAPAGVLTPEIKAALAAHKPALLALLAGTDDRTDPGGTPEIEPIPPVRPAGRGLPQPDRRWQQVAAIDRAFGGGDPAPAGATV